MINAEEFFFGSEASKTTSVGRVQQQGNNSLTKYYAIVGRNGEY